MKIFKEFLINNISTFKKILVAPLPWGLGHATRCIPMIDELIKQNCQVFIAAEGAAYHLLKKEFPSATFLPLTGYKISYTRQKAFFPVKLLLQFPRIISSIYKEHQWLKKNIEKYNIDAVISDNRFGLYSSKIYSIYITHQLLIKTNNSITEKIGQKIHYHFIKKFNECWIPDFEKNGLSGALSHPKILPAKFNYIGGLSRFKCKVSEKKYDLLISISGPEPQRTIFEKIILKDLQTYTGKALFVRGLPGSIQEINIKNPLITFKNHLAANELNEAMLAAEMIISRCGYTTVMDVVKLKKKAILVPTPGQTEQEYLAGYLKERKIFYTTAQKDFSLQKALYQASTFTYNIPEYDMEHYKKVVDQFVQSL